MELIPLINKTKIITRTAKTKSPNSYSQIIVNKAIGIVITNELMEMPNPAEKRRNNNNKPPLIESIETNKMTSANNIAGKTNACPGPEPELEAMGERIDSKIDNSTPPTTSKEIALTVRYNPGRFHLSFEASSNFFTEMNGYDLV